jgi:hypothetical protein
LKRIFVRHKARSANRVFQYLCALKLQDMVPGAAVHGYDLDIFGLRDTLPAPPEDERNLVIDAGHELPLDRLAHLLNADLADSVTLYVYGQRLEYLPPPAQVRTILGLDAPMVAADRLAIHIRAEDIFAAPHPDYPPLPFAFYERMIAQSAVPPVFFGQLDAPAHVAALRQRFPTASFRPAAEPLADFKFLMGSAEAVLSVSTFAWLAAWISPVTRRIVLPVSGFFNPAQRPEIDLLPLGDERYAYFGFPVVKWAATDMQMTAIFDDQSETPLLDEAALRRTRVQAARAR